MEIDGAVVIVTGASSGIGAATARLAAGRGAKVVLAARRVDRIKDLADDLPDALAVPTDLRDPAQIVSLVDATLDRFGCVNVLVNNAGQGLHVPIEQVRLDDLRAITELNVYGPLLAMQAVIPPMRRQGGGVIVNVSSMTSRMVLPGVGGYSATKSALNMLSQVARRELASDGIDCGRFRRSSPRPAWSAAPGRRSARGESPSRSTIGPAAGSPSPTPTRWTR